VEAVQRKGVRVSVISSIKTAPPMVADELRRQADQFIELAEIATEFTRRPNDQRQSDFRADRAPPDRAPTDRAPIERGPPERAHAERAHADRPARPREPSLRQTPADPFPETPDIA
jgi:hypothetical protein